jgi:hypothetical protein
VIAFRLGTAEASLSNDRLMPICGLAGLLISGGAFLATSKVLAPLLLVPSGATAWFAYWNLVRGKKHTTVPMAGKVVIVTGANAGESVDVRRACLTRRVNDACCRDWV